MNEKRGQRNDPALPARTAGRRQIPLGRRRRSTRAEALASALAPPSSADHVSGSAVDELSSERITSEYIPPTPRHQAQSNDSMKTLLTQSSHDTPGYIEDRAPPRVHQSHTGSQRLKRISGMLSHTAQLFVDGLALDEPSASLPSGQDGPSPQIKPTMLGWLVIGAMILLSVAFVVFRKIQHGPEKRLSAGELLRASDLKGSDIELAEEDEYLIGKRPATLDIEVSPADALIYLAVGKTPIDLTNLNPNTTHTFRVERAGYVSAIRRLSSKTIRNDSLIMITLEREGKGTMKADPIQAQREWVASPPSHGNYQGKGSRIAISSNPPGAMLWRLVGQRRAVILRADPGQYQFKIVRSGYKERLVTISERDFPGLPPTEKKDSGEFRLRKRIQLERKHRDSGNRLN